MVTPTALEVLPLISPCVFNVLTICLKSFILSISCFSFNTHRQSFVRTLMQHSSPKLDQNHTTCQILVFIIGGCPLLLPSLSMAIPSPFVPYAKTTSIMYPFCQCSFSLESFYVFNICNSASTLFSSLKH